jgi:hypothetical protein
MRSLTSGCALKRIIKFGSEDCHLIHAAWRRIARICASVYLLVFIRNPLVHLAWRIQLLQPLAFEGVYLLSCRHFNGILQKNLCMTRSCMHVGV